MSANSTETKAPAENPSTPKPKPAAQSPSIDIQALKAKLENEEQIRNFFTNPRFEKYWYLNFDEFRQIFGERLEDEALGKVKKYWAEINTTYYNMNYELLWYVKWVPVVVKYATNILRLRIMSMLWLLAYLETVDFFVEPMILHYYKKRRIIRISEAFDYHLTKPKYQEMRTTWLERYLACIQGNIQNAVKLGADKDNKLIRRINRQEKESMFESIDKSYDTLKKEDQIPFKKEIDQIKKLGFLEYARRTSQQANLMQSTKNTLARVKDLYFEYKRTFMEFPKRRDFENYLSPVYFPGERKMKFTEELDMKLRRIAKTVDYALDSTKTENLFVNMGLVKEEETEKKEKRKLSILKSLN